MQDGSSKEKNTRIVPATNTEMLKNSRTHLDESGPYAGHLSLDWSERSVQVLDDFLPRLIALIS